MKKAQVSLEYLILTSFILVIVIIIFALALFNYETNVKLSKVGGSLDSLVKTADLVYAKGKGTALFATVNWPNGVKSIEIVNKCKADAELSGCTGEQTNVACVCLGGGACNNSAYACLKYSAVHLVMDDGTDFLYGSKAKLCLKFLSGGNWVCPMQIVNPEDFPLNPVEMKVKVLWITNGTDDYIALQGIPD